jgi:hypothetical protein
MKLSTILIVILGELAVGTALFVILQQTKEIRKSFFTFQSYLVSICFFLISLALSKQRFFSSEFFPPAVFAAFAAYHFSRERFLWGKGMLTGAALLGFFFLFARVDATSTPNYPGWISIVNLIGGTLFFGWVNGTMILGHWYLIMRGLSFGHLQRATLQLLILNILRAVGFGISCWWISAYGTSPFIASVDPLFFWSRVVWGLVLPGIFNFMAWRCALMGSNQAGTGLLYISEVAVLLGEILAASQGL